MTCFSPLQAIELGINDRGKKILKFLKYGKARRDEASLQVSCGQCVGCRLERSRQWAVRCYHEAKLYDSNCFITLTYDDNHLPVGGTLVKADFQCFMKRFRKRCTGDLPVIVNSISTFPIRYFMCGEYGDLYRRPHYHACIFNYDFPDKEVISISNGIKLYTSKLLRELWPFGYVSIGSLTFKSAAYVARYIMKKHFGKNAWVNYADVDWNSGEVLFERIPEYANMSRRSGIGKYWFDKYKEDTYKDDYIVLDGGIKVRPPRYYDSHFELFSPGEMKSIKDKRISDALLNVADNTPERLEDRRKVLLSKIKLLNRKFEFGD